MVSLKGATERRRLTLDQESTREMGDDGGAKRHRNGGGKKDRSRRKKPKRFLGGYPAERLVNVRCSRYYPPPIGPNFSGSGRKRRRSLNCPGEAITQGALQDMPRGNKQGAGAADLQNITIRAPIKNLKAVLIDKKQDFSDQSFIVIEGARTPNT